MTEDLKRLFPIDIPEREVTGFRAKGYSAPVSGVRFTSDDLPEKGIPLGGMGTGCIDLDVNGTLGQCSIFNSFTPRRGKLNLPFLGISVGSATWQLSTLNIKGYKSAEVFNMNDPVPRGDVLLSPKRIHYWGHYPIADIEYEMDCPVSVGLRTWSPFIPGDSIASNTPGAVFEINIRNKTEEKQSGNIVFSFPGPSPEELGGNCNFTRRLVQGSFSGAVITNESGVGYALGLIWKDNDTKDLEGAGLDKNIQIGGELGIDGGNWSRISSKGVSRFAIHAKDLPENVNQAGVSIRIDYSLNAGEEKVLRYVLAWYAPEYKAGGTPSAGGNSFYHKYAERFAGPREVAEFIASNHTHLLNRIISWQEEVYSEKKLPDYLKEYLINILYLLPESSFWAQARHPIGDWCRKEDGLFCIDSGYSYYPLKGSISDSYTSEFPIAFFFKDLIKSTIRAYKAYQYPSGAACWSFGGVPNNAPVCELTMPTPGYQTALNGVWLAGAVSRLWNATGDDLVIEEFYPMIKKNMIFTMGLNRGPDGVVSMPDRIVSAEFETGVRETLYYEMNEWYGIVTHLGGDRLTQLRLVLKMAEKMGDNEFAEKCREWIKKGSASIENNMWNGSYYDNYLDKENNLKSDLIFAYTFDGDFIAMMEGLKGSNFNSDRKEKMLETIKKLSIKDKFIVPVPFVTKEGTPVKSGADQNEETHIAYDEYDMRFFNTIFLLANLIENKDKELALEIIKNYHKKIVCELGLSWSIPEHTEGLDYMPCYLDSCHQMAIWAIPALIIDGNIKNSCHSKGFINRINEAAKDHRVRASE